MVNFRFIPNILITRPMAYVARYLLKKPIAIPDGDRRNKDTIYFPKALAEKGQTILDRKLTFSDVFESTPHISPNARGLIGLNALNCVGCRACERICPNKCIEMVEVDEVPPHWVEKQKTREKPRPLLHPQIFIGRCLYCGFCVESCKYDALHHTAGFDAATSVKEDLHHSYRDLYQIYQLYCPEEYTKQWKEYEEKWGNYGEEEKNNQESTVES
ncbi:MAG: 4Fe-4S dicluster domain-containing protein [Candidatus Hodarchaeales archaeon]